MFLLIGLYATSSFQESVKNAYETLDNNLSAIQDTCHSGEALLELGQEIYKFDKSKAEKVLAKISDYIEEGGFQNIRRFYDPLTQMGFCDLATEISDINQRGSGKRR